MTGLRLPNMRSTVTQSPGLGCLQQHMGTANGGDPGSRRVCDGGGTRRRLPAQPQTGPYSEKIPEFGDIKAG